MKKHAFLLIFFLSVMLSGCYDDSGIWDRFDKVEDELELLKSRLNDELKALKDMLDGTVSIAECTANEDGTYDLELSNGVSLTVMDGADLSAAITCRKDADGKNYWAVYSEDGGTVFLTDSEDNKIPVSQAPSVITRDGERYLVIGEEEYYLAGESIFSSYTVNKNDLTDEVVSVTFGFGEGMSFTVTVDGANMFAFVRQDVDMLEVLEEYFVSFGMTEMIMTQQVGVLSYIPEMPRGWEYEKYTDEAGNRYLKVTAPEKNEILDGKAVPYGYINVIAVLEGGKAMASELFVTTEPFENVSVLLDDMSVTMSEGLMKYMYGLIPADTYSDEAVMAKAAELLAMSSRPEFGVAENDVKAELSDVYGEELVPGLEYMLWAVPALWVNDTFVCADFVKTVRFRYGRLVFADVSDITFDDAQIQVVVEGVSKWYGGLCIKENWQASKIVSDLNNGLVEAAGDPSGYNGSLFDYCGSDIIPEAGKTYVAWAAIGKDAMPYKEEELICREVVLKSLTAGGTLDLELGQAVCEPTKITVPLSCSGAERIYYAFVPYGEHTRYSTDELKANYVFENGGFGLGESVEAVSPLMKPKSSAMLFAMPVSADGKYGKIFSKLYTTSDIPFNSWTVTLEESVNKPLDVRVKLTVKDASGQEVEPSDYLYWAGETSLSFWKNSTGLGGGQKNAQQYMWLNADKDGRLKTKADGEIRGGEIRFTGLAVDTECVVVIMAKDAEGNYSKAGMLLIDTFSVDFGDVVWAVNEDGTPNPKWEAMRPVASEDETATIVWRPEKFVKPVGMRSGEMAFGFNCPAGFKAYVMYGTENYMIPDDGDEDEILYGRERMVHMIKKIDKKREKQMIVGEEGGHLISEWFYFPHGNANEGSAVVFDQADWEEHKQTCSCEENSTITDRVVYFNRSTVEFRAAAIGKKDTDRVYVMYVDSEGNFYEPYYVDVPYEYYENAPAD